MHDHVNNTMASQVPKVTSNFFGLGQPRDLRPAKSFLSSYTDEDPIKFGRGNSRRQVSQNQFASGLATELLSLNGNLEGKYLLKTPIPA